MEHVTWRSKPSTRTLKVFSSFLIKTTGWFTFRQTGWSRPLFLTLRGLEALPVCLSGRCFTETAMITMTKTRTSRRLKRAKKREGRSKGKRGKGREGKEAREESIDSTFGVIISPLV